MHRREYIADQNGFRLLSDVTTKLHEVDDHQEKFGRLLLPESTTTTTTTTPRPYFDRVPPMQQWLPLPPKVIPVFQNPERWNEPPKNVDRIYLPPLLPLPPHVQPAFPTATGITDNYYEQFPFLPIYNWPTLPPRTPATQPTERARNNPLIQKDFTSATATDETTDSYLATLDGITDSSTTTIPTTTTTTPANKAPTPTPSTTPCTTTSTTTSTTFTITTSITSTTRDETSPTAEEITPGYTTPVEATTDIISTTEEEIFVPNEYDVDLRSAIP